MIATKGLKNNTMAKKCLQKRLQNSPNNTKQAQIPQNIDTRKTKQTNKQPRQESYKQTNKQIHRNPNNIHRHTTIELTPSGDLPPLKELHKLA